mmetsp:Transcript_29512/g.53542  ORF Transcript_29512/g.53542 Transcript_29512/m.53542 type:complete len:212 (+) Transcript_29512:913-1548(+)
MCPSPTTASFATVGCVDFFTSGSPLAVSVLVDIPGSELRPSSMTWSFAAGFAFFFRAAAAAIAAIPIGAPPPSDCLVCVFFRGLLLRFCAGAAASAPSDCFTVVFSVASAAVNVALRSVSTSELPTLVFFLAAAAAIAPIFVTSPPAGGLDSFTDTRLIEFRLFAAAAAITATNMTFASVFASASLNRCVRPTLEYAPGRSLSFSSRCISM